MAHDERTLRINEAEAETVRTLYALYRKHGTLRQVKAEADRLRLRTNQRLAADGTRTGDVPAAVEFGRVAAAPVNTLRQQTHRCQEISVCF